MCRNWKRIAALGLTVILGCMAPMSTMLAAEDGTETEAVAPSDSEADREDVDISQGGNTSEEESAPDDESVREKKIRRMTRTRRRKESTPTMRMRREEMRRMTRMCRRKTRRTMTA